MGAAQRVPYKVSKSKKYWPGTTVEQRIRRLVSEFTPIHEALSQKVETIRVEIPTPKVVPSLSCLKRYEDALDALICGWVGIYYLDGKTIPYGDRHAAIWVPQEI